MQSDGETGSTSNRILPDPKVCSARGWIGLYAFCLVESPSICRHAIAFGMFGTNFLCSHPRRELIVAKTKAIKKDACDSVEPPVRPPESS